ncbi:MAG TPA: hypothetical protein VMZ28_31035 [Kofleriaceae bacterium]|nr:hypothetical protein [Kofleriaceae bacterium]
MSEPFVIVHRTYDPIQADLVGDLLRDAGIAARVVGTRSGASIGVGQVIMEVHIAVPQSQAGQATDFLEAFLASDAPATDADADPDSDSDPDPATERELRPMFAAGSAFLTFGVGHLYARRPWTAAALAAGQIVAMYYLFAGRNWDDWTIGITLLASIIACDLVGATVATRAHRRGIRRGVAWQAGFGALYVGGSMALALAVGPRLADPTVGPGADQERRKPLEQDSTLRRPFERDPSFPPLTSQHPANPSADR